MVDKISGNIAAHRSKILLCAIMTWTGFPHYWPFVMGNHWSSVDFPHIGWVMESFDVSFLCQLIYRKLFSTIKPISVKMSSPLSRSNCCLGFRLLHKCFICIFEFYSSYQKTNTREYDWTNSWVFINKPQCSVLPNYTKQFQERHKYNQYQIMLPGSVIKASMNYNILWLVMYHT